MIINGNSLLKVEPIRPLLSNKEREFGYSHGLSEAGYDIRIAEDIIFMPPKWWNFWDRPMIERWGNNAEWADPIIKGRFCLASTIEEFMVPSNMTGIVHDKSTWARQGLSVFNTVIEPGWRGFLTLELAFNGEEPLHIPSGVGIAQVLFHQNIETAQYSGKYQDANAGPQKAKFQ